MQQRVTESENRSNTLEAQVADMQATQQDIITTMTMLRADLEAALDPIRAQQASGGADLRSLQTEIVNLQEQLLILTEQLAAYEATATDPSTATQEPSSVAMPPSGGDTRAAAAGATDSAEDALFNAHADSPRAADAMYWIGESLAAQELHAEARRRFLAIAQDYPASAKVPDALLRAALEAVELGQLDDAVRELNQLVATHTNSDAALIGCMQLDRLGQPLPAACRLP